MLPVTTATANSMNARNPPQTICTVRDIHAGNEATKKLPATAMPSVLIETGFLSNNTERQYLNSAKGQEAIARGVYRAFKQFKEEMEK